MMNGKKLLAVAVVLALMLSGASVFAGGQKGKAAEGEMAKKIEPKFASEEIEGDFMTVWAENFADEMREWSDGQIDIAVYPYGTLGDTRDINELCQIGVVEFVFSDFGWISSFVPQAQVLALNYLWPQEKMPQVLEWVVKNGKIMGVLEEHFRHNGLVPLGIVYEGWQWVSSKTPKRTLQDFGGFKVRVMGSKLLVEDYKSYGASPTPMSYGEVYSGLQMGLIDGQVNPLFAIHSMKFYEVQDYLTQIWSEPFVGIPTVNKQFFDSLPEDAQAKMRQFWADAIIPSAQWIDAKNKADLEKMLADRPEIEVYRFTAEDIKPFKEQAQKVYSTYLKLGGEGTQAVLNTLLQDIENAKKAVGVQ
jgi:TRAP-type C4-dicarboxylate transport system substrate-binding protein